MIKRIIAFFILLYAGLWCLQQAPSRAAGWLPLAKSSVVAYVGPGDIVGSATAWWGLRGYSMAYSTGSNPAAVVCDSATFAVCTTINILSNGNFDTATASGSSSCSVACVVKSLTDQTGGGQTLSCASAGVCPTLTFNCLAGTLPCMTFAGAQTMSATVTNLSQPITFVSEFKYTSTATGAIAGSSNTGNIGVEPTNTNIVYFASNAISVASSVNTQYALGVVLNGVACASNLNGSLATGSNCGANGFGGGGFTVGRDLFNLHTGTIDEFGIWPVAFNTTQLGNMNTNLTTYW